MLAPARRTLAALLGILMIVSGCSGSSVPGKPQGPQGGLAGGYELIGDVGATQVNDDATVTLTLLPDGKLTVKAVQPGEQVTDTGTWQADGQSITIEFTEMKLRGNGRYSYDGTTLRLPLRILGDGKGESEWKRVGAAPSQNPSTSPAKAPAAKADWSQWDLDNDAAAAGTKAYADAVAKGVDPLDAVKQAEQKLRSVKGVKSTALSDNGRNIRIEYAVGSTDWVITERLETEGAPQSGGSRLTGRSYAPANDCPTLPGAPSASGQNPQPTREAVVPSGFGVQIYQPSSQPTPVTSADSPSARRALLIAPQYDVLHALGTSQSTIRLEAGNNIECLQRTLTRSGYEVDTVLGKGDAKASTLQDSGYYAVESMTHLLQANHYGVVYFLGHGAFTHDHANKSVELPMIWMGSINWDDEEVGKIVRSSLLEARKLFGVTVYDPTHYRALVAERLTKRLGLTWDPKAPPLWIYVDADSRPVVAVHPAYFAQLRSSGVDFSQTLLWLNACNTGKTSRFQQESGAAAFVGWKRAMAGQWIGQAAAAVFDMLADKARTLRAALDIWTLHEAWQWREQGVRTVPANQDTKNLLSVGRDGSSMNPTAIAPQTHILIFHLRHAPSSATSDIAKSAVRLENCWSDIWEPKKGALASPVCNALKYGSHTPTRAEIDDALYEVGVATSSPVAGTAGRWTLAD